MQVLILGYEEYIWEKIGLNLQKIVQKKDLLLRERYHTVYPEIELPPYDI